MKICPKCQIDKPDSAYYKTAFLCKVCFKEYLRNKYAEDSSKIKATSSARYKSNTVRCNDEMAKWRKANPDKCKSYCAKRTAKVLNATPKWANSEFETFVIQEMYSLATLRSKLTGRSYHVDHIVPLNSKIVQGLHCVANLQILEATANIIKGNRSWPDQP